MQDKVRKNYKLDQEVADAIGEIAGREGVTQTEAVSMAVMAYADGGVTRAGEATTKNGPGDTPDTPGAVSLLQANVDDLRAQVATLTEQLAVKDAQIEAANRHIDQAQALHAATDAANARQLESAEDGGGEDGKRGFWSRLFNR